MLKDILNEYELDWASVPNIPRVYPDDFPFAKLNNKTFIVSGEAALSRCIIYSLLKINEEKKLNFKVIFTSDDKNVSDLFYSEILKEYPLTICRTDELLSNVKSADYYICTGVCNKNLQKTAHEFIEETSKVSSSLLIASKLQVKKFVLLSDYRVYGKNKNGVLVSENEVCKIRSGNGTDFDTELLQSLEALCVCYAKQYGFNHVILRSAMMLGANTGIDENFLSKLLSDVANGKETTLLRSHNKYTFVYITDVLLALFYSFEELNPNTSYNVAGKNSTISTGILAELIYDIFPDITKISLVNCNEDPCLATQINTSKIEINGFEPTITPEAFIQLFIKSIRYPDLPFGYEEPHGGKLSVIQNILLKYLLEMDRICKKHNIKYFLAGGTLLGAIRHNGFIPWDDDADVMMLREDYDKFLKIAQSELPSGLFLQTSDTDKHCHYPFAKIRLNNTMFATKYSKTHNGMNNGMAFDIFAHDNTANSSIGQKLHLQLTLLVRSMIFNKWNNRKIDNGHKIQSFIANILKHICPIALTEWFQYKIFKMFKNKKNSEFLYDGMGRNVYKGSFPKAWLDEVIYHDFEGYQLPIPKEYDNYLRYLYGDYMALVPASDRRTSHDIVMLDLGEHCQTSL